MSVKDYIDFPLEELQARIIAGDPKAEAYMWICRYAENLTSQAQGYYDYEEYGYSDITFDELMQTADSHQGGGWGDYISRGGTFEGESVDPTFWEKYAILKDLPLDKVEQSSFFTCSC